MSAKVLFVDDDPNVLNAFKRRLRKQVEMVTATGGAEGLTALAEQGPFSVVISDQQMPEMDGVAFLKKVATRSPDAVRMMLTGNADQETAAQAINDGNIFRFLTKPCQPEDLLAAINEAKEQYRLRRAERDLLEQTLAGSIKLLIDILSLQNARTFDATARMRAWARRLVPKLRGIDPWQLDMAIMLAGLGRIVLPTDVLAKLEGKAELSPREAELVNQSPGAARDLVRNIPRLEAVADAIYYQNKGFDGSGFPDDDKAGEDIPVAGRVLKLLTDLSGLCADEQVSDDALAALKANAQLYDPALIDLAAQALTGSGRASEGVTEEREVDMSLGRLAVGDHLLEDVTSEDGEMILAAGHALTEPMIHKLWQLNKLKKIQEPIRVRRRFKVD